MTAYTQQRSISLSLPDVLTRGGVALGDLILMLTFVVIGIHSHGGNALAMPMYTLDTLLPFLLTWILIAPLVGLYYRRTLVSYRWTLLLVPVAWTLVSVFGAQVRATSYFYGGAPLDFIAVNIVFGILFLLPWRLLCAAGIRRYEL